MRVLLVEDNPTLAKSLTDALTQAHFTVDCMHDGEAADHVLRTQDYALVILDLGLPKLDGLEVLRRIRSSERTRLLPVVILTSSAEERDILEGYRLGTNSYVRKPVDFVEFTEAVRQLGLYWLLLNQPPPTSGIQ